MADLHPLREYRSKHRPPLSQSKLGERLGVTKFAVSKWESGARNIEAPMAEKIEAETGIDARILLGIPKKKSREVEAARC